MDSTAASGGDGRDATPDILEGGLERLRGEIVAGLVYTHRRVDADSAKLLESAAFMYAAIELLAERGLISIAELDERKSTVMKRLVPVFLKEGMGVIFQEPETDKYTFSESVDVDCAGRIQACQAACCRLSFALSVQDVEEGVIHWELGDPYMIRHGADGYCHHLDRATLGCSVYDQRPIPCRAYRCRGDKRVWRDFENGEPHPDLAERFRDPEYGRASIGNPSADGE